ncbi:activating signal cointegrator 1 isoform X2 [Prorops nasuta]|uniref:activating signal cointegrator 1 isoform X2 n=1 Tax=Prorops nasuta TaxID=863751 RepID=UPI0034CF4EDF
MEEWVKKSLSEFLDFPVHQTLVEFVLDIQDAGDLEDYLQSLLKFEDPKLKKFITELKRKQASLKNNSNQQKSINQRSNSKKPNDKKKGKTKAKDRENTTETEQLEREEKLEKAERKKTKFVNLYARDSNVVLLKGRQRCNCEAKKHALINNCLNCGKIVCVQEGSGPCFFCGELVCSMEEQNILSSNSKQSDKLYNKLMNQKDISAYEESLKHRNKLIDFDRNSTKRTTVIDDESDYYQATDAWLSAAERERVKKMEEEVNAQKYASRFSKKLTFDFAGRQIVEEDPVVDEITDEKLMELFQSISLDNIDKSNICPNIEFDRPTYIEIGTVHKRNTEKSPSFSMAKNRVQDKEYLEMADEGYCLSLHQPYASLLVEGIKMHEGRTWYTPHRGRLWIAAAAKAPDPEDVSKVEQFYRLTHNEGTNFPSCYPVGCLLGCVTVTDVLSQEEYQQRYPNGESTSPFVFICENAFALPLKFPIQGKYKIYKLDTKIHRTAMKCLEKAMKTIRR